MKAGLIIAYVLIGVLAFVAFMQYRTISKIEDSLKPATPNTTPTPNTPTGPTNPTSSGRTSISAGDLTSAIQDKMKSMDIKVNF